MPHGVLWGDLYLAYVHSQMNPQMWTKVGANRSSRLRASQDFWMFDPLKPATAPLCLEGQFVWRISIPRWICQIWCQSVQPFDSFNILLNVWPLNPQNAPWDIEGRIVFSLCPFPDESADVYQIWCQSVQLFDRFPRLLNLWPLKTTWVIEGRIVFSLCRFPHESADLYQIWCQSVQPFDSFPKRLNLWPPKITPKCP